MWKMLEDDFECDECGGPGPPPLFNIPPPPRPPGLYDLSKNCNEDEFNILTNSQNWDSNMCEALPLLDASFYNSQSLQTSAIIGVFSLLLVLVVLISSLFLWKNKRKVQNFLPCKTPTRGPHHLNGGLPGAHSVTYEDPDAHLGHRPLVVRHHHNVELIHPKSIHYPSGYPMTRSPPFLMSNSPGPDPYRSNDNVYEELGPGRDSDGESEPPLQSDDDFAEDELSLPGERSFNKSAVSDSTLPVSTIYHERLTTAAVASTANSTANPNTERNSVLSDATTVTTASTASTSATGRQQHNSHRQHQQHSNTTSCSRINNNRKNNTEFSSVSYGNSSNNNGQQQRCQYYNTLDENEVQRRNRINNQLHNPTVSTIHQPHQNGIGSRYPYPYYMSSSSSNSMRSKTNPRCYDRRRIVPPSPAIEPAYGYAEPIFNESGGYLYDSACRSSSSNGSGVPLYPPYILPDYVSAYSRTMGHQQHPHSHHQHQHTHHQQQQPPLPSSIYSRDSSFGSDSGYSHHTAISRRTPTTPNDNAESHKGLFSWGRRSKKTCNDNNSKNNNISNSSNANSSSASNNNNNTIQT
ncbi:hypothetical protein ACFFRR_000117 [Megaselia abdita]